MIILLIGQAQHELLPLTHECTCLYFFKGSNFEKARVMVAARGTGSPELIIWRGNVRHDCKTKSGFVWKQLWKNVFSVDRTTSRRLKNIVFLYFILATSWNNNLLGCLSGQPACGCPALLFVALFDKVGMLLYHSFDRGVFFYLGLCVITWLLLLFFSFKHHCLNDDNGGRKMSFIAPDFLFFFIFYLAFFFLSLSLFCGVEVVVVVLLFCHLEWEGVGGWGRGVSKLLVHIGKIRTFVISCIGMSSHLASHLVRQSLLASFYHILFNW